MLKLKMLITRQNVDKLKEDHTNELGVLGYSARVELEKVDSEFFKSF